MSLCCAGLAVTQLGMHRVSPVSAMGSCNLLKDSIVCTPEPLLGNKEGIQALGLGWAHPGAGVFLNQHC